MAENIETVNQFLRDEYGIDTEDSLPIWRIVWSESQFEKRETKYTDSGIALLVPEVRTLPKYSTYMNPSYILERRVLVPEINQQELAGARKSYEPLWVFKNEMSPTIQGCKFIVDTVLAAQGKKSLNKYKDPLEGLTPAEAYELNKARVDQIQIELFGDESDLKGETVDESGSAIFVPTNYDKIH